MRNDSLIQSKIKSLKFPFFLSGTRKVWPVHTHTHTCKCQASRKKMPKPVKRMVRIYSNTLSNQKAEPKPKKRGRKKPKSQKTQAEKTSICYKGKKERERDPSTRKIGWVRGGRSIINKGCVTIAIYIKKYLKAKEEYGNSNISSFKNIIFKKILSRNQNPPRYHNSITHLKFQNKQKYHLSKILI